MENLSPQYRYVLINLIMTSVSKQVVTALLLAGLTVTLWMEEPCLHPPAYTQDSFAYNCMCLASKSFQLMHIPCDDHAF